MMKKITLQIHENYGDMIIIGAVGKGGENTTTCTIPLRNENRYTIRADGRVVPFGDNCEEVPR